MTNMIAQGAIVAGSVMANRVLSRYVGNKSVAEIASKTIAIGGTAVNAILAVKTSVTNNNLRAYYGHSREVK